MLDSVREAVVIGGGVLGLEAAWELKKSGCKVTVLEAAPQLMGRQLDEEAGNMLKAISQGQGIRILTSASIEQIEGEEHVTGVRLSAGEVIPAQLVIVSAGVRPNIRIAQEAGLSVDRGVLVNSNMLTNTFDVYACGDCAQFDGINYAIWPQAVEQGKTAGANAAGETEEYTTVPAALTFNSMNTSLYANGDTGKNPNLIYKTVEFKDMGRKQYEKCYFLNNKLCGVILIGDISKMARYAEAMQKKATFKELF